MKMICKRCGQAKDEAEFKYRHQPSTMCIDCRKRRNKEYYRKNERLNKTKWMDIIIGRS